MVSKGNERATGVPHGQLELMPSSTGADEREPERPEGSNVPPVLVVAEPGEGDLPDVSQHELGRLLGNRSPAARNRLHAAMRMQSAADIEIGAHTAVEVTLLDGHVLWDWDRFAIGRELHLPVRFHEYVGGDPVAFLCAAGLHERQLSQSLKALIVVSMCQWQPRGRPRKSTTTVAFPTKNGRPRTIPGMADLAGVGTTLISQAKDVWSFGLAEDVRDGKVGFNEAYRRARVVKASEWQGAALNGEMSFEDAYERAAATALVVSPDRRQATRSVRSLNEQVRRLERSNAELEEELRSLREDNEVQRSKATAAAVALERERMRADQAEAEVDRLRSELARAGLEP